MIQQHEIRFSIEKTIYELENELKRLEATGKDEYLPMMDGILELLDHLSKARQTINQMTWIN